MSKQNYIELREVIKKIIKQYFSDNSINRISELMFGITKIKVFIQTIWGKAVKNKINIWKNRKKKQRYLEIGPGQKKIGSFETLNIVGGNNVDYVFDASNPLPFKDNTFDLIYASHILEHIPWYQTEKVLGEWIRILKPGGKLKIWVPDAEKICKVVLKAEEKKIDAIPDEWIVKNPKKNPIVWASGRLFWGANPNYPSWHKALFTPNYLKYILKCVGLKNVKKIDSSEIIGYDHGWINLGVKGEKP